MFIKGNLSCGVRASDVKVVFLDMVKAGRNSGGPEMKYHVVVVVAGDRDERVILSAFDSKADAVDEVTGLIRELNECECGGAPPTPMPDVLSAPEEYAVQQGTGAAVVSRR